uniref:Retrovirus-related Pol polyprotein from transposon TNT 1-94 n=1 Tax=Tanacetum cinerariifolium TaxID=118510 RepID=A0A6L2LJE9_TANCI|nr:retrovirus-related Pol polyprotein from transposon TNT 1-94 [Tanacetum cinerariifolium]
MHNEFEMSMMGELNFFLGLQIRQIEDGIFFNQSKYIKETLKKFGLEDSKPTKTPMSTEIKLTKDDKADFVDNTKYRGTEMPSEYQQDYKKTLAYALKIYNDPNMTEQLKYVYRALESRYVYEGRTFNLAYFIIMRMCYFRDQSEKFLPFGMILTRLFKNLKANLWNRPFDERYILLPRKMSSLKEKRPKRPPSKRTRDVGKSKRTQLTTSSSSD